MVLTLWQKVGRVRSLLRQEGLFTTAGLVWRRLRHGHARWQSIDVLGHYAFAMPYVLEPRSGDSAPCSLLWFIPDFNVGSGGHLNIFRTIWHLEQKGYRSTIVIVKPAIHFNAQLARDAIQKHFFPLQAEVVIGLKSLPSCEFAVATGWDTAYAVRAFQGAQHKLYFVQDFEPYFYAVGSEATLAENTYSFGFYGITAGQWLAEKLHQKYAMQTHPVGFGVELDRYRRMERREPQVRRVFFYARPPTPRRAFELGMLVLNAVWERLPETQFVLAGWDTSGYQIPFTHLACGTVSLDDLPDLYSQCDVALVLSLTNASLLPLELMACGCAVVSNSGANVEWLMNDTVARLARPTPEALTEAVCALLQDDEERRALCARAEAYARAQTWEAVAGEFEVGLMRARASSAAKENECVA